MRAKVLKIDKSLFDDEVIKIVIPGEIGELCILPHHMPIITPLKKGQIRIFLRPFLTIPYTLNLLFCLIQ